MEIPFGSLDKKGKWNYRDGLKCVSCPQCGWIDAVGQRGYGMEDDSVNFYFRCRNPEAVERIVWIDKVVDKCQCAKTLRLLPKQKRKTSCTQNVDE